MPMTVEQLAILHNGSIYFEESGTLAERIDFAWTIYSDIENDDIDCKEKALEFLIYAFDLSDTKPINQQLITLMDERKKYQDANPEYIPSKQPHHPALNPSHLNLQMVGADAPDIVQEAIASRELLDLKDMHKYIIDPKHTRYLNADERAYYRVHIRRGLFFQDGNPFDTLSMESHGRLEFAAYTINANGELSVFTHLAGGDGLYHSSMNAGAPVVSAGELKIQDGILLEITTSSGHYNPSLFNIHRTLEYFSLHHVDISEVQVRTYLNPAKKLKNTTSVPMNPGYSTPATDIYKGVKKLMSDAINTMASDINKYKNAPKTTLFGFFVPNLTQERIHLADKFKNEIQIFEQSLRHYPPSHLFEIKIPELIHIISRYQDENTRLFQKHKKSECKDQLAKTVDGFKERVGKLKSELALKTPKEKELAIKMKKLY